MATSSAAADAIETSQHEPGPHNNDHASERTPLLRTITNGSAETAKSLLHAPRHPKIPRSLHNRITISILAMVAGIMLGSNMQPAVRVQIYEDVICKQYYAAHPSASPGNGTVPGDRCKALEVQEELAVVKGYEFFLALLPTLLCGVLYGRLSERIGRRAVLILGLVGMLLSQFWSLAVCYWSDIFPIRYIWLSGLIQIIGGGDAIASSVVHVMVADYTDEAERTQIFLYIHGVNVLTGVLGPIISGVMIDTGYVWECAIAAEAIVAIGAVLSTFIPETLGLRQKGVDDPVPDATRDSDTELDSTSKPLVVIKNHVKAALGPVLMVFNLFASNKQALLLLLLYAPILTAREAFSQIGLIYMSKKFGISFGRGSVISSLSRGVESITVLAIVPGISTLLTSPRFSLQWSPWTRDRVISIFSFALMSGGHFLLGIAPAIWIGIVGLTAAGLGCGAPSTVLSMLASAVRPEDVSLAYSIAYVLCTTMSYSLAPVLSALFNKGMHLGWDWEGLPFIGIAGLMALGLMGSFFVSKRPIRSS